MNKSQRTTEKREQKILKEKGLIAFIVLLSVSMPLSTDLYIPALPEMTRQFAATEAIMNMSLALFFVTYGVSSLFWGPLSDRHGRKPVLIVGILLYLTGSAICVFAGSAEQLLAFRVLQAFGGGVALSLSAAVVRDVYNGRKLESIMALIQSMTMICPVVAPVIGAFMLNFMSWRGLFAAQALFGAAALCLALCYNETIMERSGAGALRTFLRLAVVIRNPKFAALLFGLNLTAIGSMAFIGASSYIYQDFFGMSSQTYSYFYAAVSVGMIAGPILYVWWSKRMPRGPIITACLSVFLVCGVLILLFGARSPWFLSAFIIPMNVFNACLRPPVAYLMLAQQRSDIGSASSLMTFVGFIFGSVGMVLVSASPLNMILALGVINAVVGAASLAIWFAIRKRYATETAADEM
jgi:DHA1 family bicyclomycin/chloramphenicol resistance-like MFS transporter